MKLLDEKHTENKLLLLCFFYLVALFPPDNIWIGTWFLYGMPVLVQNRLLDSDVGSVCPLPGHEQGDQHQTFPHRQGLQERQPSHDQGPLSRVLPVCKFFFSSQASPRTQISTKQFLTSFLPLVFFFALFVALSWVLLFVKDPTVCMCVYWCWEFGGYWSIIDYNVCITHVCVCVCMQGRARDSVR